MRQITDVFQSQLEIEKSKFITYLIPIESEAQAKEQLALIKKQHPKANHHCSAYIINTINRSNDDGEPASTAGLPMLQTLLGHQMNHILAVVVRYFGGVLLGKGGLIRAYSQSVSNALNLAEVFEEKTIYRVQITVNFKLMNVIETQAKTILKRDFDELARYTLQFDQLDELHNLQELTFNQTEVQQIEEATQLVRI